MSKYLYIIKNLLLILSITLSNQTPNIQRNLEITTFCNIKNCLFCKNRNECSKCDENYELANHRCYSKKCSVYGFCQYCDEYDCLKCKKGYKMNYGICDESIHGFEIKLILGIGIPIILIFLIIYLYKYCKKKNKTNIETGKILKYRHPKPGNYFILLEQNSKKENDLSISKNILNPIYELHNEKNKAEINFCVVCGKKKIYTYADCRCALCFEHFKMIKNNKQKLECRIHKVLLSKNIIIQLGRKSNYKGNAVEKLGLSLCPICKINQGTQSFNCGCNMRICGKCFNDNVYVLKYNQCPGCSKPYIPDRHNIKLRKRSNDSTSTTDRIPDSNNSLQIGKRM